MYREATVLYIKFYLGKHNGIRTLVYAYACHDFQSLAPSSRVQFCAVPSLSHTNLLLLLTMKVAPPSQQGKDQRWSNRTKAYKILKEGLEDGSIDPNNKPKDVHESNPEFLRYSLPSFYAGFNWLKSQMGVHLHDEGKLQSRYQNLLPC